MRGIDWNCRPSPPSPLMHLSHWYLLYVNTIAWPLGIQSQLIPQARRCIRDSKMIRWWRISDVAYIYHYLAIRWFPIQKDSALFTRRRLDAGWQCYLLDAVIIARMSSYEISKDSATVPKEDCVKIHVQPPQSFCNDGMLFHIWHFDSHRFACGYQHMLKI